MAAADITAARDRAPIAAGGVLGGGDCRRIAFLLVASGVSPEGNRTRGRDRQ